MTSGHHHSAAYSLDAANALRSVILRAPDMTAGELEDALIAARERGVTQQHCDDLRRAWQRDQERRVVVWHATFPDRLTGSDRRGGGDPLADYRWLKGEL